MRNGIVRRSRYFIVSFTLASQIKVTGSVHALDQKPSPQLLPFELGTGRALAHGPSAVRARPFSGSSCMRM